MNTENRTLSEEELHQVAGGIDGTVGKFFGILTEIEGRHDRVNCFRLETKFIAIPDVSKVDESPGTMRINPIDPHSCVILKKIYDFPALQQNRFKQNGRSVRISRFVI